MTNDPATNKGFVSPIKDAAVDLEQAIHDELPKNVQWAVNLLSFQDKGRDLAQAIRDGSAQITSDGSYKEGFGTSATLARCNSGTLISGNIVPGETGSV